MVGPRLASPHEWLWADGLGRPLSSSFLWRRLAVLPVILLGVTLVLFAVSQVIPADPVQLRIGHGEQVTPDVRASIEKDLGLDKSVPEQYLLYMKKLATGDLGQSIRFDVPVLDLVAYAVPKSIELVIGAIPLTLLLS